MAYPPYHSNHTLSPAPIYPMWGQPGSQTAGVQIWGHPGYHIWHPTESCHWKPYQGVFFLFRTKFLMQFALWSVMEKWWIEFNVY